MFLKHVHKFFDTPPINTGSLIPFPLEHGLLECLAFSEQNDVGVILCEFQG